jgi:hypothetical protein
LLPKVALTGFTPRTRGGGDVAKKIVTRDLFLAEIHNLPEVPKKRRGKELSLDVCFYLFGKSSLTGRAGKDLDNLLKIVLDTLPDYMDKLKTERGLGLIEEDNDHLIFEIHATKQLVSEEAQEGMDLEIFEWIQPLDNVG